MLSQLAISISVDPGYHFTPGRPLKDPINAQRGLSYGLMELQLPFVFSTRRRKDEHLASYGLRRQTTHTSEICANTSKTLDRLRSVCKRWSNAAQPSTSPQRDYMCILMHLSGWPMGERHMVHWMDTPSWCMKTYVVSHIHDGGL